METSINTPKIPQVTNPAIDIIPQGDYCYEWIEKPNSKNNFKGSIKTCPHYTTKTFNGVEVPWCLFLNCGGISNHNDDSDIQALVDHFGSEERMNEILPLSLLWDQVKECGENLPKEEDYGFSETSEVLKGDLSYDDYDGFER
jgi:hypothetical protein